ncbi:hypothetical protein PROFUN_07685 [Planoprotostelium fungivorum]|uniref:Uncharacterized protein n=1 Tax=Planoprotostelium fungivorum TaxID=1890364 RepID=A0A2P6MM58_9EUKA|nr:hypothetical protein PROFUN_07685 [Planoprotostelium fungivorum]
MNRSIYHIYNTTVLRSASARTPIGVTQNRTLFNNAKKAVAFYGMFKMFRPLVTKTKAIQGANKTGQAAQSAEQAAKQVGNLGKESDFEKVLHTAERLAPDNVRNVLEKAEKIAANPEVRKVIQQVVEKTK